MSEAAWHVLHTKYRKEGQVASYLQSQGIEVFYPVAKVKPVNPRASNVRAYFPGYLFTHVDISEVGIAALQWAPGLISLVQFGGEPAIVPDNFIYELHRRIAEIAAAGGLHLNGLKHGDTVRITSGPFAGCDALFDLMLDDHERVQVFIHWLGRRLKMQVNANVIAKQRLG